MTENNHCTYRINGGTTPACLAKFNGRNAKRCEYTQCETKTDDAGRPYLQECSTFEPRILETQPLSDRTAQESLEGCQLPACLVCFKRH
jgi:hypothetical protein